MSHNRLGSEASPYLLQHKDNPVHWWPWGEEALAEARRTGKPILLSVGYAACHWCHVMAHESFEDEATAAVMNELFVNIKVDREERPDIDAIYMSALHQLGEQGGWPLTMFLTPDAKPFWGGTYFPKEARFGKPAFVTVLREIARIAREEPEKVAGNAGAIMERLEQAAGRREVPEGLLVPDIDDGLMEDFAGKLLGIMDSEHGGIRGAPKFPQCPMLWFLWRAGIRYGMDRACDAVKLTLAHMAQGGIYDHLGGGFARYSVDERWLVPHFEKMLYDNALLLDLMGEVWRETRSELLEARIEETVGWVLREMTLAQGGFAASLDADSEGEEGRFYVWRAEEIEAVLGAEDAAFFAAAYDVTPEGNWEGKVILNRLRDFRALSGEEEARLAALRARLLAAREERVRPGFDDKVLADWNGLMIRALARLAVLFDRPKWYDAARRAYGFVSAEMAVEGGEEGRLWHAWREGTAGAPANATDYANMIAAALALAQAGPPEEASGFICDAERWLAILERHYWAAQAGGGYAFSADDTADVIVRLRSGVDEATPNANGTMLSNLVALYLLTGKPAHLERAEAVRAAFQRDMAENPLGHASLFAANFDLLAPQHVAIVGPEGDGARARLARALRSVSLPGAVEQVIDDTTQLPAESPLAGKGPVGGASAAYVCVGPQCSAPVTEPDRLVETLRAVRRLAGQGAVRDGATV